VRNCFSCGSLLEFLDTEVDLSCYYCGEQHKSNLWCPEGHFVCPTCYQIPITEFIEWIIKTTRSKDPFEIAMMMMGFPQLPDRSCEHAWIFAAALLTAIKNEGSAKLTDEDIFSALETAKERAVTRATLQTGVCGMGAAVGIAFHAVFKAMPNRTDLQDDITMKVVAEAIEYLADNSTNCRCCKNVVWTIMDLIVSLIHARFGIELEGSASDIICHQVGAMVNCDPLTCQFSTALDINKLSL